MLLYIGIKKVTLSPKKTTYFINFVIIKSMKKLIIILCFVSLFISCTKTPEQKFQNLIKEYLTTVLNDPKSYESVSFGTLDNNYGGLYPALYTMKHTYRARNKFGGVETKTYKFYVDLEPTYKVLGME